MSVDSMDYYWTMGEIFIVSLLVVAFVCFVVWAIVKFLSNHFHYPYFVKQFNVSKKKNVDIDDYIDRFLNDENNRKALQTHEEEIRKWKHEQERYIEKCFLKEYRRKQYLAVLDDEHAYHFRTVREQTRYRQKNYVRTSYKVTVDDSKVAVNWAWIVARNKRLAEIGYEATLKEYHVKNQRRLMTPKLRQQIKERDNFTCQICGKYMPDEVGLHIDHIVPVAKGGKTVPSNLQVLCSKCNGKKSAKLVNNGEC